MEEYWSVLVDVESILNGRLLCPLNTLPEGGLEVPLFGGKTSHCSNSTLIERLAYVICQVMESLPKGL